MELDYKDNIKLIGYSKFELNIKYIEEYKFVILDWKYDQYIKKYNGSVKFPHLLDDYMIVKNIDSLQHAQRKIGDWEKMITKKLQKEFLKSDYYYKYHVKESNKEKLLNSLFDSVESTKG